MAEKQNDVEIPDEFVCPITQELMSDPVIGSDGCSYERAAIVEALMLKAESPMTRQPMTVDQLATNYALRNLIEKWRDANKGAKIAAPKPKPAAVVLAGQGANTISLKTVIAPHPTDKGLELVQVTVKPAEEGQRRDVVVIALLDVSGSMSLDAAPQGEDLKEAQGFSRIDLVKHSMKTITKVLTDRDYLGIVTFSDRANIVFDPRRMDGAGQTAALTTVDKLDASGGTNIWDALRVGVDMTKTPICKGKDVVLLLLTDGEPTINPPKGIVETLRGTLATIENQNFTISSFGFGYNLDSLLLDDIARLGNGSFGFIPDCSMVGTIFINFLANSLATRLHNARLVLENTSVSHLFSHKVAGPNSVTIPIGSIRYGQKRTVLISRKKGEAADAGKTIKVSLEAVSSTGKAIDLIAETAEEVRLDEISPEVLESYVVGHCVDDLYTVARAAEYGGKTKSNVKELQKLITTVVPAAKSTELVKQLLLDIESANANEGQLTKAVSRKDWFDRWGRNHLLSFCNAHRYEQCSNFKDKSLQLYGGVQFKKVQDIANEIFVKLPPPAPSANPRVYGGGAAGAAAANKAAAARSRVNMAVFMNSGGGCFDGEGLVTMADGSFKRVAEIRKGDRVLGGGRIVAVVQTLITNDKPIDVVHINGVLATPYHPVMYQGQWTFPKDIAPVEKRNMTTIYDFVLNESHSVIINGMEFITMAHERNHESEVLAHPYFGTKRILEDLSKFPGWDRGHVLLHNVYVERDTTGLTCSIRPAMEVATAPQALAMYA